MWFGIVYLGSLLTLLWQSIYTFDDFTMQGAGQGHAQRHHQGADDNVVVGGVEQCLQVGQRNFTMSVTSDFTLANLQALFNPANYDIIVRTLVMACHSRVSSEPR
jgi:putative spermidine/putrescine transport system permease protein